MSRPGPTGRGRAQPLAPAYTTTPPVSVQRAEDEREIQSVPKSPGEHPPVRPRTAVVAAESELLRAERGRPRPHRAAQDGQHEWSRPQTQRRSCAGRGVERRAPRNGRSPTHPATATNRHIRQDGRRRHPRRTPRCSVDSYASSLAMKPSSGGNPAIDNAAIPAADRRQGHRATSPPKWPTSRVPVS